MFVGYYIVIIIINMEVFHEYLVNLPICGTTTVFEQNAPTWPSFSETHAVSLDLVMKFETFEWWM